MILVTGATGTVGRAVVDRLLATGAKVRAATRRPASANLPAEVDVVHADLTDPASLTAALDGVERVFLLASGSDIIEQDTNLAEAAARAGVAHVVKLSSGRAGDPAATDPLSRWHRAGEQAVRDRGLDWTFLRPLGFMANVLPWANTIRERGVVYAPYAAGRIAAIDPDDIASVAATALTTPGHAGHAYQLTGPAALSPAEQVATLADVLARPIEYVEVSPEAAHSALLAHGLPPVMADAVMALRAGALDGFASVVTTTVADVTGRPATSFHTWAQRNKAAFQ